MANANLEDDDKWMLDLEVSLLMSEATSAADVLRICKGKPIDEGLRPQAWLICLGIKKSTPPLSEIFDLPEQETLRQDCQQCVDNLGNEDEDKVSVLSDLESILTSYRKAKNVPYERENGWLELLLPLLALKRPQNETYAIFSALQNLYIPNSCTSKNGDPFHLFRLLLLYHDPELCSYLDTKRITPDMYCRTWFQTLFAANCELPVVLAMWDLYFQHADPFFLFFLSLVMVVNGRKNILQMENGRRSKEEIIEMLTGMPCGMEVGDVTDFCSLAQYYAMKTPASFREELKGTLFGDQTHSVVGNLSNSTSSTSLTSPSTEYPLRPAGLSQALCLPVCASELLESVSSPPVPVPSAQDEDNEEFAERVRFFLVDCRPAEQYNAGHLPTAFHLDCNLMLQEPTEFSTAVQGLLSAQKQALAARSAAAGDHLCFLGSGRVDEDQYTHMVIASFLQKHTSHVSMLTDGFRAIHEFLGDTVNQTLEHHNKSSCLVCVANSSSEMSSPQSHSQSVDLFSKLSAAVSKLKKTEVKGKILDYIVNPIGASGKPVERHVSAKDKLGKRYRNVAPVFSIDDDQEFDSSNVASQFSQFEEEGKREIVNINQWMKEHNVEASFPCQELNINNILYNSTLMLTQADMYLVRQVPNHKGQGQVVARRSLNSIVKITSRKKRPDMITFKYGTSKDDDIVITDMDRLIIPNAKEATNTVTELILRHLGNNPET